MFLACDAGFAESYSVTLRQKGNSDLFTASFYLHNEIDSVCFALSVSRRPGRVEVENLSFYRRSPVETLLFITIHALRLIFIDQARLRRNFRNYVYYLRNPHFINVKSPANGASQTDYETWIEKYDYLPEHDKATLQSEISQVGNKPLISIVMPVYNTPVELLDKAIGSVLDQIYENWELCIADDCSTDPEIRQSLQGWQTRDPRIKVTFRSQNGGISLASNSALELAEGPFVASLDHDDILRENALAEVVLEIDRHPNAQIVYSDEDKLDKQEKRYAPHFKPDFSRELFRSQNYLNHLSVHRTANIRAVGGWRQGFEGSQDYDLNLRIFERVNPADIRHIPKILYHWRAIDGSTAASGSAKSYAWDAGKRALESHVARTGLHATVCGVAETGFYRLKFAIPEKQPLVSVIIPTKDNLRLLRSCIQSILEKTTYQNYEILIVDNGSVKDETIGFFEEIEKKPNVHVLNYPKAFNYSAINNFAVSQARGSILALVNDDIEVISPDWMTEMVSWAIQDDIGCVGAKLYYPDDTVQHAGVILGTGGVANHCHLGLARGDPGYFGRATVHNNYSAVTGACLMVTKSIYQEVGGLNEQDLTVAFNDIDFCLRVQEAGFSNVWTPFAELYHLESASRGREDTPEKLKRFMNEAAYMQKRWASTLMDDPYYSPNLSFELPDFSYAQ
ncbi:MAG: glycosyltransferase [Rhizobiaceae bacterium]|nr:glycosyltransferase [Rhizobiaceae bacterium]